MLRWTQQLGVSVVLVGLVASAWSQTAHYTVPAASVADEFAAYRQALDSAADSALANVMREAAQAVTLLGSQPTLLPRRMRRRCTSSLSNIGTATMKPSVAPSRE
jgi:hypothetical protein